jgi:hypothetical protein
MEVGEARRGQALNYMRSLENTLKNCLTVENRFGVEIQGRPTPRYSVLTATDEWVSFRDRLLRQQVDVRLDTSPTFFFYAICNLDHGEVVTLQIDRKR